MLQKVSILFGRFVASLKLYCCVSRFCEFDFEYENHCFSYVKH